MVAPATRDILKTGALANQLRAELADTQRPNLRQLAVDLGQGLVTVRGTVDSFYEKQLAIHACQAVLGGAEWIDAVEVR
jgi:hypothetical protein